MQPKDGFRGARFAIILGAVSALVTVAYAAWWWAGCPLLILWDKYDFQPQVRDDLCPRREPNLRDASCVVPDLPHLVTLSGAVPDYYRVRKHRYSTNSGMYRGTRDFIPRKFPDTFRIIVQGTGVTFGVGVEDDEVYPYLLEKMLNRDAPDGRGRFQVYNMAIPGSTCDIGVQLTEEIVRTMEFDLLIFCYGVNDGLPMFHKSPFDYARALRRLVQLKKEYNLDIIFCIEPRSSFYPWPFEEYQDKYQRIIQSDPDNVVIDLPAILDAEEQRCGLRLVRDGDRQQVVRYLFGRPQILASFEYPFGLQGVSPEVYDYLDTHRVYQATHIDGVHISRYGHHVVARALYRLLQDMGIVDRGRSQAARRTSER
jgi:lysophospholipase L1-like esterase